MVNKELGVLVKIRKPKRKKPDENPSKLAMQKTLQKAKCLRRTGLIRPSGVLARLNLSQLNGRKEVSYGHSQQSSTES